MSFYPPEINEALRNVCCAGTIPDANAVGTSAAFVCGTFVKFFLRIEESNQEITEVRFKTSGCGFSIAAAEVLCERIRGSKLIELHGSDKRFFQKQIESVMGKFPAARSHCLNACIEAMQAAFADFRRARIEEWFGEKALICTCFGVSEEAIENLIENESLETVEEVSVRCSAGSGCGSCQPLIQEIIDNVSHGSV